MISPRTGAPVRWIFGRFSSSARVFSKLMSTRSAFFAHDLVTTPGSALTSSSTVGMCIFCAAWTIGKLAYPPQPMTASGWNSLRIFFAALVAVSDFCSVAML